MLLLVLHYDGTNFSGWQRQPDRRTVQGVLEAALSKLCAQPVAALGSGRTDAGVHARGQAVGVRVPARWTPPAMRRALNALLPDDLWVADAHAMRDEFHARYSATARAYSYYVGTDDEAASPFRRRTEWVVSRPSTSSRSRTAQARSSAITAFVDSPCAAPRPPATIIGAPCVEPSGAIAPVASCSRSKPIGSSITWCASSWAR